MYKKSCLILVFVFAALFLVKPTYAATFSISGPNSSVGQGSTFTAQLRLDTQGQPIDTVDVFLSYTKDTLDVTSISQGPNFLTAAEKTSGGGGIHISLAALNPNSSQLTVATGNVLVANIGFKAKALGNASIGIGGNSVALSHNDGSNKITSVSGANFTIIQATPKPSAIVGSNTSTTGPKISDLKVTNIATQGATLNWTTSTKADSTVEYGFNKDQYAFTVEKVNPKTDLVTAHAVQISNQALTPGTIVHYHVISKDVNGDTTKSDDATFQLKGYSLQINLVDNQDNPVKNTKVTLYSDPMTGTTNDQGQVVFKDVPAGKHVAVIKGEKFERSSEVNVDASSDVEKVQIAKISVDVSGLSELASKKATFFGFDLRVIVAVGAVILLALLIGIVMYIKRRNDVVYSLFGSKNTTPTPPSPSTTTVASPKTTAYPSTSSSLFPQSSAQPQKPLNSSSPTPPSNLFPPLKETPKPTVLTNDEKK